MVVASSLVAKVSTDGVDTAKSQMQGMGKSVQDVSSSLGGGGLFGAVTGAIGGLLNFGSQVGMTIFGLKNLASGAISLGSSLLQPAATAETTQLSFETLLHSTKAAHQEMMDLNTFAASTPMQTQWVDNAAAKILAFGGTTKDVIPEITAIGDSLSGLGKLSDTSLNSIVDIFGKISAQGKLTGGDMMQLSTWGIPAWQALSDAMHKPIPELQKMVSAGLIPADQAIKALEGGMEKTFGGGMAKQANTFTGIISTLASNWQIAMAALGTPILKLVEGQLSNIGAVLSSQAFQDFATNVGQGIANVFQGIGNAVHYVDNVLRSVNLTPFKEAWQSIKEAVREVGDQFTMLKAKLDPVKGDFDPLAEIIGNLAKGGLKFLTDRLWDVYVAISAVSQFINAHKEAIEKLGDSFKSWLFPIEEITKKTKEVTAPLRAFSGEMRQITDVGREAADGLHKLIAPVREARDALGGGETKTSFFSGLSSVFKEFEPSLKNIASLLSGQFKDGLHFAIDSAKQFGDWFSKSVVPALKDAEPGFSQLGHVLLDQVAPALIKARGVAQDVIEHAISKFGPILGEIIPPLIRFAGILSKEVGDGLKFLTPYIKEGTKELSKFAGEVIDRATPVLKELGKGVEGFEKLWVLAWPYTSKILKGVWDDIVTAVKVAWALVSGIIKIGLDVLSGNWKRAWQDFLDMLGGIWNAIKDKVQHALDGINIALGGMPGQMLKLGENIIKNLADGISNGLHFISDSIGKITQFISDHLPHSPVKIGPLRGLVESGAQIAAQLAEGMQAGMPKLQASLQMSLAPVASPSLAYAHYQFPAMQAASTYTQQGQDQGQPIILQIDGRTFARLTLPYHVQEIRNAVGVRI